jgi:hypothetical protein
MGDKAVLVSSLLQPNGNISKSTGGPLNVIMAGVRGDAASISISISSASSAANGEEEPTMLELMMAEQAEAKNGKDHLVEAEKQKTTKSFGSEFKKLFFGGSSRSSSSGGSKDGAKKVTSSATKATAASTAAPATTSTAATTTVESKQDRSKVDDGDRKGTYADDVDYSPAALRDVRSVDALQMVFARMRWFIHSEYVIPELESLRAPLVTLFKRARECCVGGVECNDSFVKICLEVWQILVGAPEPYKLPFVYTGAHFTKLFWEIFVRIRALEQEGLPEGGNNIFNGVKGVGKTTVLRVIGMVVSCVCPSIVPVFWMYETKGEFQFVSTYRLYAASHHLFRHVGSTSSFCDILRASNDAQVMCYKGLFLLDEFTVLYTEATVARGIEVVNEYREIARAKNVMFLMAASRMNIKKYVHPDLDRNVHHYPNLNQSIFAVREIPPLRDIPSFASFVHISYGVILGDEEAREGIALTGGIGRYILNWMATRAPPHLYDIITLQNEPRLWHIACELVTRDVPIIERTNYATVEEWDRWCDEMFVYKAGGCMQFLFGCKQQEMRSLLRDNPDFLHAHVFHIQRIGFTGGSSGHSNEALLCKYLPNVLGLRPDEDSLDLSVRGAVVACTNTGTKADVEFHNREVLSECCDRLVKLKVSGYETGLDRFWLVQVSESDFIIHGVQIKTGKDDAVITAGNIDTQRGKNKASLCDDTTVAGILSKAERGFLALLPELKRIHSGCNFAVGKLYVCTNKTARRGFENLFQAQQIFNSNDVTARHQFPTDLHAVFGCSDCECILYDGIRWIEEMLPEHLRGLI